MTNDTIYKGTMLRRWEMNSEGVVGCFKDAIDLRLHSNTVCDSVNAHNELILTAEQARNEYIRSLNVSEPGDDIPLTIMVDEEEVDNPVWVEYNTAQGIIANTPNTVIAWINSLNPRPYSDIPEDELTEEQQQEIEEWENSVQVRNSTYVDTAPSFTVVTDGPALYDLNPSQFWALIRANNLEDSINDAFDTMLPGPENAIAREFARASFYEAKYYRRNDPLFKALGPMVGLSDEDIDNMWNIARNLTR